MLKAVKFQMAEVAVKIVQEGSYEQNPAHR